MVQTANSADIPENEHLWRSLSQSKRDLIETDHARQREIAVWLWRHNGFAKRFGQIVKDFTAGADPYPKAEDDKLQELLDGFWDHHVNQLRKYGREIAEQVHILGEQFVTLHINETDGELKLGYLDPDGVECVVPMPGNPRDLVEVHLTADPGKPPIILRIIRTGEPLHDVFDGVTEEGRRGPGAFKLKPRDPALVGEGSTSRAKQRKTYNGVCVIAQVNKLSNGTRGTSSLFSEADYLDGLDKATFNATERSFILNTLTWDHLVDNNDTKVLKERQTEAMKAVSRPGGVFTHNSGETLEARTPNLGSQDLDTLVRVVKLTILGGWGFPLAWFADPADSNRATLSEQGTPTARTLQSMQNDLRRFLRSLCELQVDLKAALAPEQLSGVEDPDAFEIVLPLIVSKDTAKASATLAQSIASVTVARDEGLITKTDEALLVQQLITELMGYEFSDLNAGLLEDIRAEDEAEPEEETDEERPFDDGLDPDEEEFADQQEKPLPPAMAKQAEKMKRAAG